MNRAASIGSRPTIPVIAVAGPPGAGKTTLAGLLARELGGVMLSMDDYQSMTAMPIPALVRWADRGADYDALPVPRLARDLAALRDGVRVVVPSTGAVIDPQRCIVFETHFGRAHRQTAPMIDLLLWLDTPPDVALARSLRAALAPEAEVAGGAASRPEARLRWVAGYLEAYLTVVARLVHLQVERIRPGADLCVAPDAASGEIVTRVRDWLEASASAQGVRGGSGSAA